MRAIRVIGVCLALLLCARAAGAEEVRLRSGSDEIKAYLAVPRGGGPHPALVVIHEWWGLTDWIRAQADRLARQGYVVVAVDLYRGKATSDPEEAHELSRGLPHDRAMRDLRAVVGSLEARPDLAHDHVGGVVGCIGWCMGGGYALDLARTDRRIRAAVIAYGRPVEDPAELANMEAPLLGIFGTEDRGIPPASVRKFWVAVERAGKRLELHEVLGVGHAFMNPANKSGYNGLAAGAACADIDSFLARFLRPLLPSPAMSQPLGAPPQAAAVLRRSASSTAAAASSTPAPCAYAASGR